MEWNEQVHPRSEPNETDALSALAPEKETTPKPIDIAAEFGDEPDVRRVDAHVRAVMQHALVELARRRRLPVLG